MPLHLAASDLHGRLAYPGVCPPVLPKSHGVCSQSAAKLSLQCQGFFKNRKQKSIGFGTLRSTLIMLWKLRNTTIIRYTQINPPNPCKTRDEAVWRRNTSVTGISAKAGVRTRIAQAFPRAKRSPMQSQQRSWNPSPPSLHTKGGVCRGEGKGTESRNQTIMACKKGNRSCELPQSSWSPMPLHLAASDLIRRHSRTLGYAHRFYLRVMAFAPSQQRS